MVLSSLTPETYTFLVPDVLGTTLRVFVTYRVPEPVQKWTLRLDPDGYIFCLVNYLRFYGVTIGYVTPVFY